MYEWVFLFNEKKWLEVNGKKEKIKELIRRESSR